VDEGAVLAWMNYNHRRDCWQLAIRQTLKFSLFAGGRQFFKSTHLFTENREAALKTMVPGWCKVFTTPQRPPETAHSIFHSIFSSRAIVFFSRKFFCVFVSSGELVKPRNCDQ